MNRIRNRRLAALVLTLLLLAGCAGNGQVAAPKKDTKQTPEALAYKGILVAFDAYDLGMSAAAALWKNKVISDQQWAEVKKGGSQLHYALLKALDIAEAYAKAKADSQAKESLFTELEAALAAVQATQAAFKAKIKKAGVG